MKRQEEMSSAKPAHSEEIAQGCLVGTKADGALVTVLTNAVPF